MKTALCFSGQPRGLKKSIENIKWSLIEKNNCDIFAHIWIDESLRGKCFRKDTPNDILEIDLEKIISKELNPICVMYNKQIFFEKKYNDSILFPCLNSIKNPNPSQSIQSMFYSMLKSNELKREYETMNNFEYDCVIRCRTDYYFSKQYNLKNFDLTKLNIKSDCNHTNYAINDHIAFSNSKIMDMYNSVFLYLDEYYNNGIEFNPEVLLGHHIKNNNICVIKSLGDNNESFINTKNERGIN